MNKYRKFLPVSRLEIIDRDPVLRNWLICLPEPVQKNPFLAHYRLWCMGLRAGFPTQDRVVLMN